MDRRATICSGKRVIRASETGVCQDRAKLIYSGSERWTDGERTAETGQRTDWVVRQGEDFLDTRRVREPFQACPSAMHDRGVLQ